MSGSQISVICPSCDEHFLIDVVDITAHAQLAAAQKRIAELEQALIDMADERHAEMVAALMNEMAGAEPAKE